MSDDPRDDRKGEPPRADRRGTLRGLRRRLLGEDEGDTRSLFGDAREVMGAVIEGSDKARTEMVKAVAREVRMYLDELGLKEDVRALMTNYSVEMKLSLSLKKLTDAEK